MKTLTLMIALVLLIGAASLVSFGQKRELTEEEYSTAINSANRLTRQTFPRRVSNFNDDKLTSLFEYESRSASRYVSLPDAKYSYKGREYRFVGAFGYVKDGDGDWSCNGTTLAFGGAGLDGKKSYYVDRVSELGKNLTSYTTIIDGEYFKQMRTTLIDEFGRLVLEREPYGFETRYEYEITLEPIVAPNIRCLSKDK